MPEFVSINREWKKITIHCENKAEFEAYLTIFKEKIKK